MNSDDVLEEADLVDKFALGETKLSCLETIPNPLPRLSLFLLLETLKVLLTIDLLSSLLQKKWSSLVVTVIPLLDSSTSVIYLFLRLSYLYIFIYI